jgi:hypothetical protein
LMLALLATSVSAQDFSPSILVDHVAGPAPLSVTIDMCASTGRNLRFGWDYDGDGIDDQRGPCRRTVDQAGPIRVTIWEAVGTDRGRYELVIEPPPPPSDEHPLPWEILIDGPCVCDEQGCRC